MRIGGDKPSGHSLDDRARGERGVAVAVALVTAFAAVACQPEPKVGAPTQGVPSQAQTFGAITQGILAPRCATSACHAGSPPPAEPTLDAGVAWSALVAVPSPQASGTLLVEPFVPDRSYLVMKLRGTAANAGGIGTLMPPDAALDEADIAAIEAWISNGAPND